MTYPDGSVLAVGYGGSASTDHELVHDAWGRLVRVVVATDSGGMGGGGVIRLTVSQSEYNGLHQRTVHRSDQDVPADGHGEHVRVMYYDASWRLVEERIDVTDAIFGDERVAQTVWGVRGLDDPVLRRWRLASQGWPVQGSIGGGIPNRWWYLTDQQSSSVALIDGVGAVAERVRYDGYGRARHHHGHDVTGDGGVNSADYKAITDLLALAPGGKVPIDDPSYLAEYDVDRSGVIDSDDAAIVSSAGSKVALTSGRISATGSDGPDNVIGYAGYVYNRESGLYTVRFRHYDPATGRFLEPDPAGYVDGTNLYQYVLGNPLGFTDPLGLFSLGDAWEWLKERGRDAADGVGVIVDYVTGDAAEEDQAWINAVEKTSANRRAIICQLYQEGKISAEDAARMLAAEEGLVGDAREGLTGIVEEEGRLIKDIAITVASALPMRIVTPWVNGRIVIGESMVRVKRAAFFRGARVYKPGPPHPSRFVNLLRNGRWIDRMIKKGKKIIDIGIDRRRPNRSPYYELERRRLVRPR